MKKTLFFVFVFFTFISFCANAPALTNKIEYDYDSLGRIKSISNTSVIDVPDAPTIGTATAGNGQATISFTAPDNDGGSAITGYIVTSTPGGKTTTGSASPITVSGLTGGTAYTFTVVATNAVGSSLQSAPVSIVTLVSAPDAPTNVTVTAGNGQASVSFATPANGGSPINGYAVTVNPDGTTFSGTASPITVTGLVNHATYSITVTATNNQGTGQSSTPVSVTINNSPRLNNSTIIDAPHNQFSCSTCHDYGLWWKYSPVKNTDGSKKDAICKKCHANAAHSSVEMGGAAPGETHRAALGNWSVNCVDCHDTHFQDQLSWRATDASSLYLATGTIGSVLAQDGQTTTFAYSNLVVNSANWNPTGRSWGGLILVENTVTAAKTLKVVTIDNQASTIKVQGSFAATSGTSFGVMYGRLIKSGIQTPASGPRSVKFFDPGAVNGLVDNQTPRQGLCQVCHTKTNYWTNNGGGSTHNSNAACTSCHFASKPGAPTAVTASAGNGQATISFTAPANNGGSYVRNYTVTSTSGGKTATGTSSPITVSGLTNGTAYTFTVVATNVAGNSVASAASSSVTPGNVPGAPTNVNASRAGNGQITINFTAPANGGTPITAYTVTSTPGSITATSTDPPSSPITIGGLTNGISYTFKVTATNAVGTSLPSSASNSITPSLMVTTLAGTAGQTGNTDATGAAARFYSPAGLAVDGSGNIYVADYNNHTIRKITPAGVVATLAGTAGQTGGTDATGTAARFNGPGGVAVDGSGNIYVADYNNHTIRKITSAGVVTTLAGTAGQSGSIDGTGVAAQFNGPFGVALAVDGSGTLFVTDSGNHTIRMITSAGEVSTIAGTAGQVGSVDDTGTAARFNIPLGIAVDASYGYIIDANNHTIRKISTTGVVTTLAGTAGQAGSVDGIGTAARFNAPWGVALATDGSGNLFVTDSGNNTIRMITSAGVVSTQAGAAGQAGSVDGGAADARFNFPFGIAVDGIRNYGYITEFNNSTIRKIY